MSTEQKEKSPPGRLHHQVTPQSAKLKQLLVDGYIKNTAQHVPSDIIKLCSKFYDEVMYWKLDCAELEPYYKSNKIYTDKFEINDIELKCSFYPNKTDEDSVFYLHVFLPKDIERISIYSEVFCSNNDAHFRYVASLKKYSWIEYDSWLQEEYVMYLKCEQFESIHLAAFFEILSIKYTIQEKTTYLKPICMKRNLSFTWHFDLQMIKQFRDAGTRQMFLSETFDEYNSNWGLSIVPMDYDVKDMNKRRIQLVLNLCKRPTIENLEINCKVTNDYDNKEQINNITFGENDEDTFRYLKPLFSSKDLFDIDELSITVEIEVISAGDSNLTDKIIVD